MKTSLANVTLAILAGGEGSRMGQPKGELTVGGLPLAAYLLKHIDWPGPTMLVTSPGREHPPGFEAFDIEVVDSLAGQGPLRGILTALENMRTDLVAILTVDMPCVSATQLDPLVDVLANQPDKHAAMFRRERDGKSMLEPFPSIYRRCIVEAITAQLESNRRSVSALANLPAAAVLPAPSEWPKSVWTNLNDPSDLDAFLKTI